MKPLCILQNGSRSQDPIVLDGTIGAVIQTYRMTDVQDNNQKYPFGLPQGEQKQLAEVVAAYWKSKPRVLQMFEPYAVLTRNWDKVFGATDDMIQAQIEAGECEVGPDFALINRFAFWLRKLVTKPPAKSFNDMEHWPNNSAPQQYEPAWSRCLASLKLTPQELNNRCAWITYNALVQLYTLLGWGYTHIYMNGINGPGCVRGQHFLQAADIPDNYTKGIPTACHINPSLEPQDFRDEATRANKLAVGLVIINGDNCNYESSPGVPATEAEKAARLERHRAAIKDLTRNK